MRLGEFYVPFCVVLPLLDSSYIELPYKGCEWWSGEHICQIKASMHHGSPMPCLDMGYWGSLGSNVCVNIGPLVFFCLFTCFRAIHDLFSHFVKPFFSFSGDSADSNYSHAQPKRDGFFQSDLGGMSQAIKTGFCLFLS